MMSAIIHSCINIRGILGYKDKQLKGLLVHENGRQFTAQEVREYMYDCLAEGKRVLPFGEPCKGFDYDKGCPGHRKMAE